jgi:ketosteroid isomerase-like protein
MSTDDTRAVVQRHLDALQAGDIDRVMEDYTDESVFIVNLGGAVVGRDAIRPFMEASGGMAGFVETGSFAEGEAYLVTWTADGVRFGSDTLVVRDGSIVLQTVVVELAG